MNIKKIAASLLAAVMLTGSAAVSVSADTVGVTEGTLDAETGLLYVPNGEETLKVTYTREAEPTEDIVIPETFGEGDDAKTVTEMDGNIIFACSNVTAVSIPKTVVTITPYTSSQVNKLESITVAEDNSAFSSEDGVLFNKDKTELIKYPAAKNGASYSIPTGVTKIKNNVFQGSKIESIVIPDTVTSIGSYVFRECGKLTVLNIPNSVSGIGDGIVGYSGVSELTVDPDNNNYCSVGGVLFTKDNELVAYPVGSTVEEYSIPEGTVSVRRLAFSGSAKLKKITIPDTVYSICEAFSNCWGLETVTIPLSVTRIDSNSFQNCKELKTINYGGTKADWGTIVIDTAGNEYLNKATIVCSDGTIGDDPNTSEPTTSEPTTSEPTTSEPTTSEPTTSEPTTSEPTTSEPTTSQPTTSEPATSTPTTSSPAITTVDKSTNIEISAGEGVFPEGVEFSAVPVAGQTSETAFAYDLTFTKDGKEIQPNGNVTVKLPVPEALKGKDIFVYHVADGKYESVKSDVKDGYIIFTANKFSVYVVSSEKLDSFASSDTTASSAPTVSEGNPTTGIAVSVLPILAAISAVVIIKKKK